jgi:histidinol-phosphate aminotransferase
MPISRRKFFGRIGQASLAGAALASCDDLALASIWQEPGAVQPGGPVRLDKNENPYGPSPKAREAVRDSLDLANRYPSQEYGPLVDALARLHGVSADRIALGCGSSELLHASASLFLAPGKKLIHAVPTFDLIAHGLERIGAEGVTVPLTKDYAHDLEAMLAAAQGSAGLVYLCNPNNPTGTLTPRQDLEAFLRKLPASFTIVIDEAYHHYVGATPAYTSFLDRPVDDPRLVVMRTFSKVFGLAGLRVGYAVATPEIAARLTSLRGAFSISVLSAKAALAALGDAEYIRSSAERNAAVREEFYRQASARNLPAIRSYTNFAMFESTKPNEEVTAFFKKNNVWLGWRIPTMDNYTRVSFGTAAAMQEFWRVCDLLHGPA